MKTIRVRIAVAVTPNGCWDCYGNKLAPEFECKSDADMAGTYIFKRQGSGHVVYIEADVPAPDLPEPVTVEGVVAP